MKARIMDTYDPWIPFHEVNFITWHKPLAIEMIVLCKEVYLKTTSSYTRDKVQIQQFHNYQYYNL
jgi:hypothetical protein